MIPVLADRIRLSDIATSPGLNRWWENVESAWEGGRKESEKSPLLTRFDYQGQPSAQLPASAHRVVYSKSGNTSAAARLESTDALIDHQFYWAPVGSADEARYLVAILDSATLLERVRPLQTRGLLGARHFDKYVFFVPFDVFDSRKAEHAAIAQLSEQAEQVAAQVDIAGLPRFTLVRSRIRDELAAKGLTFQIEEAVAKVLPTL